MSTLAERIAGEQLLDDILFAEMDQLLANDDEVVWVGNEKPVDIKTFIEEKDFLGLRGKIYPIIGHALSLIEKDEVREGLLLLGKGSGKCFPEDSWILTSEGYCQASSLKGYPKETHEGQFTSYTNLFINRYGQREKTIYHYNNGIRKVYEIRSSLGFSVEATSNHPLLVFTGYSFEWKRAGDLREGDLLCLTKGTNIYGAQSYIPLPENFIYKTGLKFPRYMTEIVAELLGLLSSSTSFQVYDWGFLERHTDEIFSEGKFFDMFGEAAISLKNIDGQNVYSVEAPELKKYIGNIWTEDGKRDQVVPSFILKTNRMIQQAYLRGLFEVDGRVKDFGKERGILLEGPSTFIKQIQLLLLNMGILSSAKEERGVSVLRIFDQDSAELFMAIGFLSKKKKTRLSRLVLLKRLKQMPLLEDASVLVNHLNSKSKLSTWKKKILYGSFLKERKPLYKKDIDKFLTDKSLDLETKSLLTTLKSSYFCDKVSSFFYVGRKHTIDFTMKDSHSLIVNGIVNHNTTALQIYMLYGVYLLMSLKDPCDYYELLPDSTITELLVSVSEKQAREVGFAGIKAMLDRAPWFKGRYLPYSTEIKFENNIHLYCGHSGSTSWLGFNTVRGAMDEVEYMADTNNRSVSKSLYRALRGSLTTRFPNKFKLLLISSAKEDYSFLNSKIKQVRENGEQLPLPKIFIIPNSEKVFEDTKGVRKELVDMLYNLEVEVYKSKDGESVALKGPTWKVNPKTKLEGYLSDFFSDEPGALRDYASVATHSLTPFFKDPDLLDRLAVHSGKRCPIDEETLMIDPDFKPNIAFNYFFAGDLSVSGDRTGISMVHYDYFVDKVYLDFSLAIQAKQGMRIDYAPIRQLVYNLRDRGFNIKGIAFDQFQSNDSINKMIEKGFDARQVQYAESFVGCTQLHELIHTGRFVYDAFNITFIGECKELQIINSKRIDHLKSNGRYNSKDSFDSVVNATYICLEDYYKNGSKAKENQVLAGVVEKMASKKSRTKEKDPYDISWLL